MHENYFSHTHVSHIFTCLQSSRISRAYLHWNFNILRRKRNGCTVHSDCHIKWLAVAVVGRALAIRYVPFQLDAMCNKVYAERVPRTLHSIPPSPLRQIHLHCYLEKRSEESERKKTINVVRHVSTGCSAGC